MMRAKRVFSFVACLALLVCWMSGHSGLAESKSLYNHGMDVIHLMAEMIGSDDYVNLFTENTEIREIVDQLAEGDYAEPEAVYVLTVPAENLNAMAELGALDNASDALKQKLNQRMIASLVSQVNGRSGAVKLAAASVCTAGKTFVHDQAQDMIYLYVFANTAPVAVTFTVGEDHTVSASGMFVVYDDFPCGSAGEIEAFFEELEVDVQPLEDQF